MNSWDALYGPNVGYAQDLYDRYLQDPQSVDAETRDLFRAMGPPPGANGATNGNVATSSPAATPSTADTLSIVRTARLARNIREYGHLVAEVDPLHAPKYRDEVLDPQTYALSPEILASLPGTIVFPDAPRGENALQSIERLRAMYAGPLGYEFDHLQNFRERAWLHNAVESGEFRPQLSHGDKRAILERLSQVEGFERFLHTSFQGQKRFSIEGIDTLVLALDELIEGATETGTREVFIGMAHRGRLNVLAHVLDKPYASIFAEFQQAPNKEMVPSEGSTGINAGWTGDVKYHLGARRSLEGASGHITLADNPSHLEFVDPVVEGGTRAAQDVRTHPGAPTQDIQNAICLQVHGDAAFIGEGVVAETLNLGRLAAYTTGGTIHVIANNQIGFTTAPMSGRSTVYASDLAKGFDIPIVHVNADRPEAVLAAARLALEWRRKFRKSFLIDIIGYRRWGHNEGDEPSFTQPDLYTEIAGHQTARALYAQALAREGIVSADEAQSMLDSVRNRLQAAHEDAAGVTRSEPVPLQEPQSLSEIDTAVPEDRLLEYNEALLTRPEGFAANPKLERILARRRESISRPRGIDWGFAETLAFASILADGIPIRLTGQDTERGTFSQRHLVLHADGGNEYIPLQKLPQATASFAVYNSPLSEAAALGFEYGYSVYAPETLVIWEAQYGDFANAGQVITDQFIIAARAKWRQQPSLVLLLPHGYEGQGPEHSSARIERYLQLAADDNIRVADPSTAAQYFHLLRLQALTLSSNPRPLVVMAPKSLLRNELAAANLDQLTDCRFYPVLAPDEGDDGRVERLILGTGKITIELEAALKDAGRQSDRLALARVELLFPFPEGEIEALIRRYPHLREVVWVQEEPRNMGAWNYIQAHLAPLLPSGIDVQYVGRPERAAPAEGSPRVHAEEQKRIIRTALMAPETAEVGHA